MGNKEGESTGPVTEEQARNGVASGRVAVVRRAESTEWVPVGKSPFAASVPQPKVGDLTPKEAHKLIREAVASGVFRALVFFSLLSGAIWLLLMMLVTAGRH